MVDKRGNVYTHVGHGTATASAKLDLAHKIEAIVRQVGEAIDATRPEAMAVEEAFYHESVRSTLVLGHVRGALLVLGVQRGLEVFEYTPREVKLSVAGSGASAKEQVEFMVRRMLGVRAPIPPDAADALAVALCHLHRANRPDAGRALGAATRGLEALLARRGRKP